MVCSSLPFIRTLPSCIKCYPSEISDFWSKWNCKILVKWEDNSYKATFSLLKGRIYKVRAMMFNATFNNISVLLVEKITDLLQVSKKTLSHIVVLSTPVHLAWAGINLITLLVIDPVCVGNCKSNYCAIMTMMSPEFIRSELL